jgi:hypothetical protein
MTKQRKASRPRALDVIDFQVLDDMLAGEELPAIARNLRLPQGTVNAAIHRLQAYIPKQIGQLAEFVGGIRTSRLKKRIAVQAERSLDTLSKCLDRVQ